jgi:hypothetical protein
VHLTQGLYRTSIADWSQAKAYFLAGLDVAKAIGDKRRWCELAISLETICGPWLLTPAFSDLQAWDALLDEIYQIGRDRDDSHVLGCAVLGSLRGNRVLGRSSQTRDRLKAMMDLIRPEACELELIHRVEGCAHLASAEFAQGNIGAGDEWLRRCEQFLPDLNPGMKVRTLPALSFLFYCCMQRMALTRPGKSESHELALATRALIKLSHFARIYPIGRPEKLRCEGDLCAMTGRVEKAVGLWQGSLDQAVRLKMALAAFQAAGRLERAGGRESGKRETPADLIASVGWPDNVRAIAERAAHDDVSSGYLSPSGAHASGHPQPTL